MTWPHDLMTTSSGPSMKLFPTRQRQEQRQKPPPNVAATPGPLPRTKSQRRTTKRRKANPQRGGRVFRTPSRPGRWRPKRQARSRSRALGRRQRAQQEAGRGPAQGGPHWTSFANMARKRPAGRTERWVRLDPGSMVVQPGCTSPAMPDDAIEMHTQGSGLGGTSPFDASSTHPSAARTRPRPGRSTLGHDDTKRHSAHAKTTKQHAYFSSSGAPPCNNSPKLSDDLNVRKPLTQADGPLKQLRAAWTTPESDKAS